MPRPPISGQHKFVPWSKTKPLPGHVSKMNSALRHDQAKKKHSRRPGACEPCRKQKIKCSGGVPCFHCCKGTKKNRKKEQCWYDPEHLAPRKTKKARSKKGDPPGLSVIDEDSDPVDSASLDSESDIADGDGDASSPQADEASSETHHRGPPLRYPRDEHLGQYGMLRCINQFKSLSGAHTTLLNSLAVVQCDSTEALDLMSKEGMIEPAELIKIRPDHSLRYFISKEELEQASPDIQKMAWRAINIKDYQLDQGRIYEATFEQPYLTRSYPRFKTRPTGSSRRSRLDGGQLTIQDKVFKLIVDLEIRTKMHLGLPLEKEINAEQLSVPMPSHDAQSVEPGNSLDSLESSKTLYRRTALRALELLPDFDIKSASTRQYVELEALFKQLKAQQSAFVDLATIQDDIVSLVPNADHQIEHYSFALMLACRLALCEKLEQHNEENNTEAAPVIEMDIDSSTVTDLCRRLLQVFMVISTVVQIKDSPNWTRSYAAYSAAAILAISSLQSASPSSTDKDLVAKTVDYFRVATRELANNFSGLASEHLEKLYAELNRGPSDKSTTKTPIIKHEAVNASRIPSSRATSPEVGTKRKRGARPSSAPNSAKRHKTSPETVRQNIPSAALNYGQSVIDVTSMGTMQTSGYGSHLQTAYFEDGYDHSGPSSANTSFDASMPVDAQVYPASYEPNTVPMHSTMPFEYLSQYHPPITFPQTPLNLNFLADPSVTMALDQQHANGQLLTAQATGGNYIGLTGYGGSLVSAQMTAHGAVSPHDAVHGGAWPNGEATGIWGTQPRPDTRRSSDAFSIAQMRGHGWDNRAGEHMMSVQQPAEVMIRDSSQIGAQHIAMTNGDVWRNGQHYRYDGSMEHWPIDQHGQH